MYHEAGRSFTQVLEQLDPSEGYRGTPLENTDAFQRQLKRFGIRVKGAGSDTVEKFFSTFESAVLFPEFLARAVRQGMDEANTLPAITATVTRIDAMDYRSIYSVPEEADRSLAYVAEGASIPATAIRTREHLVRLYKRGRMLVASYEALRFQKLRPVLCHAAPDRRADPGHASRGCRERPAQRRRQRQCRGRVHRRHVAHLRRAGHADVCTACGILGAVRPV